MHGGNSAEKDQLNIMETNKKGEKVLRQTSAIVYKTNDKYAYVVSKDLKTGIIISETDKQKIYTIKDSDKVCLLYTSLLIFVIECLEKKCQLWNSRQKAF